MNTKLILRLCLPLALAACGSDDDDSSPDAGQPTDAAPTMDAGAAMDAAMTMDAGMMPTLMTEAQIKAFLEGETLLMAGDDIPTHPNGFDENIDFGPTSQCYNQTEIQVIGGQFSVTSELGTITNMMCDRDTVSGTAGPFVSNALTFSNIQGNAECFDVDAAYTGFSQEGRGRITDDGQTVELELFFMGQAVGHRCADGAVGSGGVTLNGMAFTGDAVQVYRVQ